MDKSTSQFTIRKKEDYENKINDQPPPPCHSSSNDKTVVGTLLCKFRRKKNSKLLTLNEIIDAADDAEGVLSINISSIMDEPMEVASIQFNISSVSPLDYSVPIEVDNVPTPDVDNVLPPSNERDVVPPVLEEKPAKKVARGSAQFTVLFTDSYKDFVNLSERQRNNVTAPLMDILKKIITSNNYNLSTNQLLGYLLQRENPAGSQLNKIRKCIYEERGN